MCLSGPQLPQRTFNSLPFRIRSAIVTRLKWRDYGLRRLWALFRFSATPLGKPGDRLEDLPGLVTGEPAIGEGVRAFGLAIDICSMDPRKRVRNIDSEELFKSASSPEISLPCAA
jgi:hypothetical protein